MNHWLVKQEPDSYPWSRFVADRTTIWEGVRNYAARNHLRAMKRGDAVLFYASGELKAVIGLARVTREAFPDPSASAEDGDWSAVELEAVSALKLPVTLATIKATPTLEGIELVRQSRLSVLPVSAAHHAIIVKLGGGAA